MNQQITKSLRLTDHSGQFVIVATDGSVYGPGDTIETGVDVFDNQYVRTASMVVAHWCKSHMPDEYACIDPSIKKFAGLS